MNTKTLLLIGFVVLVVVAGVFWFRPPPPRDCIHPPPLANEEQTQKANNVANALKGAVNSGEKSVDSDAKFKAAFSEALKTQYDELNDENVSFFLFSKAIYCYLQLNTKASNDVAKQLAQMLIDKHREKQGAQGTGEPLTAGERAALNADSNGKQALMILDKVTDVRGE
jgi:hypothetical protein